MPSSANEKRPTIDWTARAETMYSYSNGAREDLAERLGVSVESLERLGVGSGCDEYGERRPFWSFPERTGQLKVTGIVRRYFDGSKKTMRWSRSGLYVVRDWFAAPGPILLVEGGSDTAACLTMGLCVLGRPNNIGGVNLLIGALQGMRKRPIIVVGERDEKPERRGTVKQCPAGCGGCPLCWPGLWGCRVTAERLSVALLRKVEWRLCPTKDAREWLRENRGKRQEFLASLTTK